MRSRVAGERLQDAVRRKDHREGARRKRQGADVAADKFQRRSAEASRYRRAEPHRSARLQPSALESLARSARLQPSAFQSLGRSARLQPSARTIEHRRRAIDADEIDACARKGQRNATGAASELEHGAGRLCGDTRPERHVAAAQRSRILPVVERGVLVPPLPAFGTHSGIIVAAAPFTAATITKPRQHTKGTKNSAYRSVS